MSSSKGVILKAFKCYQFKGNRTLREICKVRIIGGHSRGSKGTLVTFVVSVLYSNEISVVVNNGTFEFVSECT